MPSGYVTVTGTSTVPEVFPSGKSLGLSTLIVVPVGKSFTIVPSGNLFDPTALVT